MFRTTLKTLVQPNLPSQTSTTAAAVPANPRSHRKRPSVTCSAPPDVPLARRQSCSTLRYTLENNKNVLRTPSKTQEQPNLPSQTSTTAAAVPANPRSHRKRASVACSAPPDVPLARRPSASATCRDARGPPEDDKQGPEFASKVYNIELGTGLGPKKL